MNQVIRLKAWNCLRNSQHPKSEKLTLAEQQQLRDSGEEMAEQVLGPDWKKPVAKKE
jgi:hypothetical protein